MRITSNTMVNNYLRDVQTHLKKVDKLNTQINTQKEINKVSDDPYKAVKIMNMSNDIKDVEKYNSNCDETSGLLDTMYESLESVSKLASDIKVMLTTVNGVLSSSDIESIAKDINGKLEELGNALNTRYIGNSLYSGSATSEDVVKINKDANGKITLEANQNINKDKLGVMLSGGLTYDYNLTLEEAIGSDGIDILNSVNSALDGVTLDMSKIEKAISDIDGFMNKSLVSRTLVSIKANTVNSIKSANTDGLEKLEGAYSLMQDIDMVEKYVELSSANLVYQSMMQVGAKILPPTILDYLR